MDEQQFEYLLRQSFQGKAGVVLPAVDHEPGLVTRGGVHGWTLLHRACMGEMVACTDLARSLLDRKADVNQRDVNGLDALSQASFAGFVPTLELLVSRGADVNYRCTNTALTALFWAALFDHVPACLFLISRGADLMIRPHEEWTIFGKYGESAEPPLSAEQKEQRCEILRNAFAEGPHISQVRRRAWERRRDVFLFVTAYHITTGIALKPLAYRQALMLAANPPLPPNVPIPAVKLGTPEQRRAYNLNRIFGIEEGFEGIFKLIVSFL